MFFTMKPMSKNMILSDQFKSTRLKNRQKIEKIKFCVTQEKMMKIQNSSFDQINAKMYFLTKFHFVNFS